MSGFTFHRDTPFDPNETSVDILGLTPSLRNALNNAGIDTVEELGSLSREELLSISGIGRSMLIHLSAKVGTYYRRQGIDKDFPSCERKAQKVIPREAAMAVLKAEIRTLGLDSLVYDGLTRCGISTVEQLTMLTAAEIKSIPGVGEERYLEVISKMRIYLTENDVKRKVPID